MKTLPLLLAHSLALTLAPTASAQAQPPQSTADNATARVEILEPHPDRKPDAEPARAVPASAEGRSSHRHLHDRIAVMNRLTVKEGETVRDAVVVGGTADIDGTVDGHLVLVMSQARLGPSTDIRGNLVAVGAVLTADPAIRIGGDRIVVGGTGTDLLGVKWLKWPQEWIAHGVLSARLLPHQHGWAWGVVGLSLLFYLLAGVLFPKPVRAASEALAAEPVKAFIFGLLALLLLVPALVLLAATGIGLLLVPAVLGFTGVVYMFGKAALYAYAGQQLGRQVGWAWLDRPVMGLAVGTMLFCLLYMVPVLGLVLWSMVLPLAVGGVIQAMAVAVSQRTNGAEPVPVLLGAPGSEASPRAEALVGESAMLPRAGFWVRLLATLVDFVMVFLVCKLLRSEHWFLPLWFIYHVGGWTWKGTTVGGWLVGLKIVRATGAPIDFSVALVRTLASLVSFAALGLGFFWAGWTREKQSWHDRIANTLVVKLPKASPVPII
ncbi:MAG: RDD family protein [Verrucomicrobia bacterium]|nr:RDD family protein [Verrucomicrobiota bacterium]